MGLPSMSEFEIWRTDEKKVEEAREVLDQFTAEFLNVQMNAIEMNFIKYITP